MNRGTEEQRNRGTGEQGNRGTGEQGNRGTEEQGNRGTGEQGNRGTGEQGNRGTGEQGNRGTGNVDFEICWRNDSPWISRITQMGWLSLRLRLRLRNIISQPVLWIGTKSLIIREKGLFSNVDWSRSSGLKSNT
jgi:hypothetical protein